MSDANGLIERLEAGETGREIDAEIYVALFGGKVVPRPYMEYENDVPVREIERMTGIAPVKTADGWVHAAAQPYTTSLDAAVALVERVRPEAWIEINGPRKYLNIPTQSPNHWRAVVAPWEDKTEGVGWAATPAAALVAALLRGGTGGE